MQIDDSHFELRLAASETDLHPPAAATPALHGLRRGELGGDGPLVDHAARREGRPVRSLLRPSPCCSTAAGAAEERVVGVYRLMRIEGAEAAGQFYSEDEYDLAPLRATGRRLLELGRSCLHRDYRGGTSMMHLWAGLADYIAAHEIEVMFGVASFHGRDPGAAGAGAVAVAPTAHSRAAPIPPPGPPRGVSADGPDRRGPARPHRRRAGHSGADQGVSAARRLFAPPPSGRAPGSTAPSTASTCAW